jgi:hypothetical protein
LEAVLDYVRIGGHVTFVGISKVPVEIGKIQTKSLTIRGTIGSPGVWPPPLRFLTPTKLDLSLIETHFFDLTRGIEAFEFRKEFKRVHQGDSDQRSVGPRAAPRRRELTVSSNQSGGAVVTGAASALDGQSPQAWLQTGFPSWSPISTRSNEAAALTWQEPLM